MSGSAEKETKEVVATPEAIIAAPDQDVEITIADDAGTPAAVAQPAVTTADEAVNDLKKQLADAKTAEEEYKRKELAFQARDRERQAEVVKFRTDAERAQYDAISRAAEAATASATAWENEYVAAMESGDWKAAGKAQASMSEAVMRKTQLLDGKAQMEARLAQPQQPAAIQAQPTGDAFESQIGHLSVPTQSWLRTHRDAILDPVKNAKVMAAHWGAIGDGIAPDSDAYFRYIEKQAGYGGDGVQARQGTPVTSAGPSHNGAMPGGTPSVGPTKVKLTANEREVARLTGLTDEEYARNKLALIREGRMEPIH